MPKVITPECTTCPTCGIPLLVVVPADGMPVPLERTTPAYIVVCHEKEAPRLAKSQGYPVHRCTAALAAGTAHE